MLSSLRHYDVVRKIESSRCPSDVLIPRFHVDLAGYLAVVDVSYRVLKHAVAVGQDHIDAEGSALPSQDLVGEGNLYVALL